MESATAPPRLPRVVERVSAASLSTARVINPQPLLLLRVAFGNGGVESPEIVSVVNGAAPLMSPRQRRSLHVAFGGGCAGSVGVANGRTISVG